MLPPKTNEAEPSEPLDSVTIIADALQRKFGDLAILAAEKQRDAATEDTVIRWEEIILRLRGR